jgi:hypothetical protein
MGQPVRIHDLAVRMVELCGLRVRDANNPAGDIEIKVTGLRPGEKLYEELLIGDGAEPTTHTRIMKAHESFLPLPELQDHLADLGRHIESGDMAAVRALLERLVSGYRPASGMVDWVHLAASAPVGSDSVGAGPQDLTDEGHSPLAVAAATALAHQRTMRSSNDSAAKKLSKATN